MITSEMILSLTRKLGTTEVFTQSGWILPDGNLLNMSGRPGLQRGRRIEHRLALRVAVPEEDGEPSVADGLEAGLVRIVPEGCGFQISKPPSPMQELTLSRFLRSHRKWGIIAEYGYDNDREVVNYGTAAEIWRLIDDIRSRLGYAGDPAIRNRIILDCATEALGAVQDAPAEDPTLVHQTTEVYHRLMENANALLGLALVTSAIGCALFVWALRQHSMITFICAANLLFLSLIGWLSMIRVSRQAHIPPITILRDLWIFQGARRYISDQERPTVPGLYVVSDQCVRRVLLFHPATDTLRDIDGQVVLRASAIQSWYGPLDVRPLLLPLMAELVAEQAKRDHINWFSGKTPQ